MSARMMNQAATHELGHAWIARTLGYPVRVFLGEDPRMEYVNGPEKVQAHHLYMVTAAGYAAEKLYGYNHDQATRSAHEDISGLIDCLGLDPAVTLLESIEGYFQEYRTDFRRFVGRFKDNLIKRQEMEFRPAGRCRRCGRALKDPESVQRGYGPVCYSTQKASA